jgi:hypothetical protein
MRSELDLLPTLSSLLVINRVAPQSYESLSAQATSLADDIRKQLPDP